MTDNFSHFYHRTRSAHATQERRSPALPASGRLTPELVNKRWQHFALPEAQAALLDPITEETMHSYTKNIEHFIGTVKLPVGIAGPILVNGQHAQAEFCIPLATTEAALVSSYHRGCRLITAAGGASTLVLQEGVTRTPGFAFACLADAARFIGWVSEHVADLKSVAESTTQHGQLQDIEVEMEGNHVYLVFQFFTEDASGQNMVTIATQAAFDYVMQHSPVEPRQAFLDANLSGDKKANSHVMRHVRGKKVTAEVHIAESLIQRYLHTTSDAMIEFGLMANNGGQLNGTIGTNAHYANALAAFYIACGQDAACVAESAVGITRFERSIHGGLCASVTLPNIMVGTVGGGTQLPSQKACLELLGLNGSGHARALAEVLAAVCLAGELSIVGAFCAGHFTRAHHKLAR
ncbi:hydroxymethylglutaryl-CoA reductase [Vibrio zhugei]|uniref:hydroxymethylglutaryl-CoA reductase (NADPH) n=1 Tax=Vibrio zhugei TaxID=2479546 RepID=A0ABV7CDZ7_9VIBR|nr:hydroxymethylglutaryl-CoA reductase [Vibrio zhugei]